MTESHTSVGTSLIHQGSKQISHLYWINVVHTQVQKNTLTFSVESARLVHMITLWIHEAYEGLKISQFSEIFRNWCRLSADTSCCFTCDSVFTQVRVHVPSEAGSYHRHTVSLSWRTDWWAVIRSDQRSRRSGQIHMLSPDMLLLIQSLSHLRLVSVMLSKRWPRHY